MKEEELVDPDLPLDDLIWRLFHEEAEVRTYTPVHLRKGCRCDPDYVRSVIARFPEEERRSDGRAGRIHHGGLRFLLAELPDRLGRCVLSG